MDEDIRTMDDDEFLAERRRIRDELEHAPATAPGRAALTARFEALDAEFLRRAHAAWNAPKAP